MSSTRLAWLTANDRRQLRVAGRCVLFVLAPVGLLAYVVSVLIGGSL